MQFIYIVGLILGLLTLVFLCFKGWGMLPISLAASLVIIITNQMNPIEALSDGYVNALKDYVGTYLLLFLFGTVFGGLMSESGAAKSIAVKLLKVLGSGKGILIVVLSAGILSYGGISLFVLVFTLYPIALVLFKEENIPTRLFPSAMLLGCATFTMVGFPGSPAIQNLIPTEYLGTNAYAAPINGSIVGVFMFALGFVYLRHHQKKLAAAGIGFVPSEHDDLDKITVSDDEDLPHWFLSLLPLLIIIAIIFLTRNADDTIFAVNIALLVGCLVVLVLFWKRIPSPLESINTSSINSITALMNTAVVIGFGGVVKASGGFDIIVDFAMGLNLSPLISASLATGVVAAATGSCSGGMRIFFDSLGTQYIQLCNSAGIPLEILHKVVGLAGAGLDNFPHSGGFITPVVYCHLNAKDCYKYVFFTNMVVTSLGCILSIVLFTVFGIV
ncbi:MAG: GntP family permease [Lachnospiraceae bacterium]